MQGAASTSSAPAATMSQAAQAAAQPPLLGLASASLSSPFGILAEEVLPEKMAHVTVLAAGVVSVLQRRRLGNELGTFTVSQRETRRRF